MQLSVIKIVIMVLNIFPVFLVVDNKYGAFPMHELSPSGTRLCKIPRHIVIPRQEFLEAELATRQCKPELFEKFFFDEKQNYDNDGVRKRFENWMYDNMAPDIEKLRELQALVVADALKLGVMAYAPEPSYQEKEGVKVDYLSK